MLTAGADACFLTTVTKTEVAKTRSSYNLSKSGNDVTKEEPNKIWYKKFKFRWLVVVLHIVLHTIALYALVTFPYIEKYKTVLWGMFMKTICLFGIGAGVHRLWSHRAYKATYSMQILLAVCYVSNIQMPIKQWVQIHRVHHKYSDTDDDPHNSNEGLLFSHIGWVLVKRPRNIVDKYKSVDLKDLHENPVVSFCDRHFWKLAAIAGVISIVIPVYCWNEEWYYAVMSQIARYVTTLHMVFTVNGFAHTFGNRPFNKYINPRDNNFISYLTLGEGWHNYHHTFPFDYRTPEIIGLRYDVTTKMIEFFEKIGWAYDLKKPKDDLVKMVIKNKGDELLQPLVNSK